jgi:hypothetical protein
MEIGSPGVEQISEICRSPRELDRKGRHDPPRFEKISAEVPSRIALLYPIGVCIMTWVVDELSTRETQSHRNDAEAHAK